MDGFLPELKSQIESKGITTRVMDNVMAKDCSYQLEYTANWQWHYAMYLTYAELKVYTNDNSRLSIGEAIYDARSGFFRTFSGSRAGLSSFACSAQDFGWCWPFSAMNHLRLLHAGVWYRV